MKKTILLIILLIICATFFFSCSTVPEKTVLRAIIIPKFEEGEMTGDFPGEAQLFYERYCPGCEEIAIPHMPVTAHFYLNEENGVGILVTGSGKTASGFSLLTLLSLEGYDCSDAYIVSVGCAGGSVGYSKPGDVVLVTAVCDYDLGHQVDTRDMANSDSAVTWFPDEAYVDYAYKHLDTGLCERVYQMIKDCPLHTTELTKRVLQENYPSWDDVYDDPVVLKGTDVSGDNYWKGAYGHVTARYIAKYYNCPDPFAVTEMEEIAIANAASCYDMLDRVISLRVIVNSDLFMDAEIPESLWLEDTNINEKFARNNSETFDIFETAMHNLFDTASIVIDAVLDGEIAVQP